jgi:hypothetical protein
MDVCAKCRKTGVGFKRCSVCKQNTYCGAACQAADWKSHKKKCTKLVPIGDVAAKIQTARSAGDWKGMLKWEGRMEELMAVAVSDRDYSLVLLWFKNAHLLVFQANGQEHHGRSCAGLMERRIPILGKLQLFWDQGDEMCRLADVLRSLDNNSEAGTWNQRARDVGAEHGFFSLECTACMGLGKAALAEGRNKEGLALLQNAVVAAGLNEFDDPAYELDALTDLITALFTTGATKEVEPLVLRFHKALKAKKETVGFCVAELNRLLWCARLHEVMCLYTPRWLTPNRI